MNLQQLEALLIDAQRQTELCMIADARRTIIAAKLMIQAEMARIGRIKIGEQQDSDERRTGE